MALIKHHTLKQPEEEDKVSFVQGSQSRISHIDLEIEINPEVMWSAAYWLFMSHSNCFFEAFRNTSQGLVTLTMS